MKSVIDKFVCITEKILFKAIRSWHARGEGGWGKEGKGEEREEGRGWSK